MKQRASSFKILAGWRQTAAALVACGLLLPLPASARGTWIDLQRSAPEGIGTMLLLSDGTVMAQGGGNNGNPLPGSVNWYKLTPDGTGGYTNGNWTTLQPMNYSRLYYSSDVLPNGTVFVAGAEYGNGVTNAELYDPVADSWSIIPIPSGIINPANEVNPKNQENNGGFMDSGSVVLADGTVLIEPVFPAVSGDSVIYDPVANSWSTQHLKKGSDEDEASTVKLPDDSILVVDSGAQTSERYIPSLGKWITDATAPVDLYDVYGREQGAGFLLPNGNAFFIGSAPVTATYITNGNPSGSTDEGSWVQQSPLIPLDLGAPDAPAAMMNNGKILCALSTSPYATNEIFTTPTSFYEYDYTDGTFTQVEGPNGNLTDAGPTYPKRMLDLPDGTVLFSDGYSQLKVYIPGGSPLAAGKPTVSSITPNPDGSYTLAGTGLNGISQGAAYGDDAQMDSNYPIIRLTDGSGNVTYARTYNWSSTSVQTGSRVVTTDFTVPASLYGAIYSLAVIANGIASDSVSFDAGVWVEFGYSGFQNGSIEYPWETLENALPFVPSHGTVFINAYDQPSVSSQTLTISTPMLIISVGGPSIIGQ